MMRVKDWGIRKRVLYLTFTPIFTVTILLSVFFVSSRITDVRQFLHDYGTALAKHLAPASEYALLTGNRELLLSLANSVLAETDVMSVSIWNTSKTISVYTSTQTGQNKKSANIARKNENKFLSFHQTVSDNGFLVFDYSNEFLAENSSQTDIGSVTVVLSQDSTLLKEQQIIYGGFFIAILGLLMSFLVAFYFGKSVTQPIIRLTHMGKTLRHGDLTARISQLSGGEVGELEVTLNGLAQTLEKSQSVMLNKVESATQELRSTVALLETKNSELEHARKEAVRAGKSKSDFLAKMSHEIRTPMNAVIGFTQLLMKTPQSQGQLEYTQTIKQSAVQLLTILDDILRYSKIESGTIEMERANFDVQQCLEDVICMLAPAAHDKGIELVLLLDSDIPHQMFGVPIRIGQVLTNLVNNAIKFTQEGSVTVKATLQTNTKNHFILKVNVRDTGIGIDNSNLQMLFDEFVQADSSITRSYGGTGLGLAIAKRLVNLMGGSIGVDSELSNGSDFWFTIPIETCNTSLYIEADNVNSINTLVVDSHVFSRRAIRNNLLRLGAVVYVQNNLNEGLKNIKTQSIDLLVLGLNQQEYEKLDVRNIVHIQKLFNLKILLLIGIEDPNPIPIELINSNIGITSKPFRRDTFRRSINQLIDINNVETEASSEHSFLPDIDSQLLADLYILVVEDHDFNLFIIKTLLEQYGAMVISATNGSLAVEKCQHQRFDLIFMDIHMPVCNGIEATKLIRSGCNKNNSTHIIALTADVYAEEENKLKDIGFSAVLLKPIVEEILISCVQNHIKKLKQPGSHKNQLEQHDLVLQRKNINTSSTLPSHLMDRFNHELPQHIDALNSAFDDNNNEKISYHAHLIHGMAGYLGKLDFTQCARLVDEASRKNQDNLSDHIINLNLVYKNSLNNSCNHVQR